MEHLLWLLNEHNYWLPYKCIQPHLGARWVFVPIYEYMSIRASANANFNSAVPLLVVFFTLSKPTVTGKKNVAKLQVEMPFVALVTRQLADKEDRLSCWDLKSRVSPRSLFIWFLTTSSLTSLILPLFLLQWNQRSSTWAYMSTASVPCHLSTWWVRALLPITQASAAAPSAHG